jgi:hypothetical protein
LRDALHAFKSDIAKASAAFVAGLGGKPLTDIVPLRGCGYRIDPLAKSSLTRSAVRISAKGSGFCSREVPVAVVPASAEPTEGSAEGTDPDEGGGTPSASLKILVNWFEVRGFISQRFKV